MSAQPNPSYTVADTIRQFQNVGLDVTAAELTTLGTIRRREWVRKAINDAPSNQQAKLFLIEALAEIRAGAHAKDGSSVPAAPAPAPHRFGTPSGIPSKYDSQRNQPAAAAPPPPSSQQSPQRASAPTAPDPEVSEPSEDVEASDSSRATSGDRKEKPRGEAFHIYGSGAALTIETGTTPGGAHTIFVDAASSNGPRSYDWKNTKIRVMFTAAECARALAVVLGYLPSASFKSHGPQKDKWIEIQDQSKNLFVKIGQGKNVRAVPVSPDDAMMLAQVLTHVIRSNAPAGAAEDIELLLRRTVARLLLTKPAQ